MDREELTALVSEAGEPGYRAKQIMDAVYRQRVESLAEISTLPRQFALSWSKTGSRSVRRGSRIRFVSQDGTVRYLIAFADGQSVETVWMPEGDGGEVGDGSEAGEFGGSRNGCGKLRGPTRPFASRARWAAPSIASSA